MYLTAIFIKITTMMHIFFIEVTTPSEFGTPTLVTAGTDLSLQTVDINQNAESYEEVNIETFDGDGKVKPTGCVPHAS